MKIPVLAALSLLSSTSAFAPNANTPKTSTSLYSTLGLGLGPAAPPQIQSQMPPLRTSEEIWSSITSIPVQGGSLRTCNFSEMVERVEVFLKSDGRPLNSDVELWQGPDNTPQKMQVYLEDGSMRPFRCVVETPGECNSISVRNTGELEFPLAAGVEAMYEPEGPAKILNSITPSRIVQGGAVYTTPFAPTVASVQMVLKTDGRPLNARIELLQGPNNNKQVMEVYSEDGDERPFYCILDTPGVGYVVRIVNTATVEFPLSAIIEPYMIDESVYEEGSQGGMTWS